MLLLETLTLCLVFLLWKIYLNVILTICRIKVFHLLFNLLSFSTFLNRRHIVLLTILKCFCVLACADDRQLCIKVESRLVC